MPNSNWWDDLEIPQEDYQDRASQIVQDTGLGFFDTAFSGGLTQQVAGNLANPNYDPDWYSKVAAERQRRIDAASIQTEEDVARAQERNRLRAETEASLEDINPLDRALLGTGEGLAGLGYSVGGILEATPGLRTVGKNVADYWNETNKELSRAGDTGATGLSNLAGRQVEQFSSGLTSILPTIAASRFGWTGVLLASGAETFGQVYEDAKNAYQTSGMTEDQARLRAYIPAVIGGVVTAALTKYTAPLLGRIPGLRNLGLTAETGVESILRRPELAAGIKPLITHILAEGLKEFPEESLDQLSQGIVERMTYNPKKTWGETVRDALQAGFTGALVGGTVSGVNAGIDRLASSGAVSSTTPDVPAGSRPQFNTEVDFSTPVDQSLRPTGEQADLDLLQGLQPNAQPAPAGVRSLRRGNRASIGNRILTAFGVSPETADDFLTRFYPRSDPANLEEYRRELLQAFQNSGLQAENSASVYSENPQTYLDAGHSQEETSYYVGVAQRENGILRNQLRQRNQQILKGGQPNATQERIIPESNLGQYPGDVTQLQGNREAGQQPPIVNQESPGPGSSGSVQQGGQVPLQTVPAQPALTPPAPVPQPQARPPIPVADIPIIPPTPAERAQQLRAAPIEPEEVAQVQGGAKVRTDRTRVTETISQFNDIIDFIANNIGKIRGHRTARPGTEEYYNDAYRNILQHSAVRSLFSAKSGSSPDEVTDDLRRAGILGPNATVDDLWEALDRAPAARRAIRGENVKGRNLMDEAAAERIAFEKLAFKERKGVSPIPVNDLVEGDEFKIGKEKVTVKTLHYDPETDQLEWVELEDGRRFGVQRIAGNQVIYAHSYKPAPTEFVPTTEQTATAAQTTTVQAPDVTIPAAPSQNRADIDEIDRRLNELQGLERLSPEQVREMDALEKRRGQVTMFEQQAGPITTPETTSPATTPEQRQAMMQGEQQRPMGAADLAEQQDMFGQTPGENMFLFEQGRLPPAQGQVGGQPTPGQTVQTARSVTELRRIIFDSDLPTQVKDAIHDFLNAPALQDLDWRGLIVQLTNQTDAFRAARTGNLIQLTDNIQSGDIAHEFFHLFYDVLPVQYKQAIETARLAEIQSKYPEAVPAGLAEGDMTSNDFKKSGLPAEDYHLINPSEYLATFAGNKFAQNFWYRRNGNSILNKIKDWFKGLVDSLKRTFGTSPSLDRIFREVMAGTFQPDLETAATHEERQGTYVRTAEESVAAQRLARNAEERQVEGWHQLAQSTDIMGFLQRFGIAAASIKAQHILGYDEYRGINRAGEQLNGSIENYRTLKQTITDNYKRLWMSTVAGDQMAAFNQRLQDAITSGQEAQTQITRPAFLDKIARMSRLKARLDHVAITNRASTPIFESAYRLAQRVLREEARNDVGIAQVEAQLAEVDDARKSSSAMSQLVTDITHTLASTADGQALLAATNPRRQDIIRVYRDIKISTGQTLANPGLINWASFILSRNAELRDTLWAEQMARNSNIRAGMGAYETRLLADLERDPAGTIIKEIRASKSRQREEDRSRFAWLTLNKEIVGELEELGTKIEAGNIAGQISADADFKRMKKEMFADAGIEGTAPAITALKDAVLLTPSGKRVDISLRNMGGTKVPDRLRKQWEDARNEFKDWLSDPANVDDPNYNIHARSLYTLEEYYYNEAILEPHDREQIFNGIMTTVSNAIRGIGGRVAASVNKVANRFNYLKENAGYWRQEYSYKLSIMRQKTLASHGIKHSQSGGKRSLESVNVEFFLDHMNEVIYSLNRQAGPLRPGDKTGRGMVVTPEDIAEAKFQADITSKGFKIIEDNFGAEDFIIEDSRSGVTVYRKPSKGTEHFVPRVYEDTLRNFLSDFYTARKDYRAALQAKDTAGMQAANQRQIDLFNQNFRIAYAMVADRSADFVSHETPFDGAGGTFEALADQIKNNPGSITNFAQLVDAAVASSATTRPEAENILMTEFGRILENLGKDAEITPSLAQAPVSGERKTAFTEGRGKAKGPFVFYRYGFATTNDLSRFSGTIYSRALDKLLHGMAALRDDINARISELHRESDRRARLGEARPTENAIKARNRERQNGTNYDHFQNLSKRLQDVEKVIQYLTTVTPEDAGDISFMRVIGGITGLIVANSLTTAKNMIAAPKYLGTVGMRMNARGLFEYLPATWYTALVAQFRAVLTGGRGIGLGLLKTLPSFVKAVRAMADSQNKGRRIRAGLEAQFRDLLMETSRLAHERNKTVRELRDLGLTHLPDVSEEWAAKMAAGIANGGTLQEHEMTRLQKLGQVPATAIETTLLWMKGLLPALGEHGLNAGTFEFMFKSGIGHRSLLKRALDKVYDAYQKSGYRNFNFADPKDPVNKLTYEELFPRSLGRPTGSGPDDLSFTESMYADAGLSLQEEAMKYLQKKQAGDPNPAYLDETGLKLLANHILAIVNKATPIHTPIALTRKEWINQITKPLLGWKARTANTITTLLSIPATSPRGKAMRWAMMATLVALPMLLAYAGAGLLEEKESRVIAKYLWGQERSARYPWEREGTKSQAIGWTIMATYGVPFLDMAMNAMLNDTPARASLDPSFVMLNKFKDAANYVGGVVQTGDVAFRLPQFIEGFMPDARILLNRIESESGKRLGSDVVALARRSGPQDLLRPSSFGSEGPNYTELSPFGPRMENAALNGNFDELAQIYNEAVEAATKAGRENPERLVRQMFQARNPFTRAFKTKITDQQRSDFLDKLDPEERRKVEQAEENFKAGGDRLGVTVADTREESPRYAGRAAPGPGGAQSGAATYGLTAATAGLLRRGRTSGGTRRASASSRRIASLRRAAPRIRLARVSGLRRRRTSLRRASRARR